MKFFAIAAAVIAMVTSTADAKSCGTTVTKYFTDSKCTQKSSRDDWVANLGTWSSVDTCKSFGGGSSSMYCTKEGIFYGYYKD